jgi:hypothetical protein
MGYAALIAAARKLIEYHKSRCSRSFWPQELIALEHALDTAENEEEPHD